MLETNLKFEKKESKVYPPFPKGIYQVELLDIEGKNEETYDSKQGKTSGKEFELQLSYQFVLLNGTGNDGATLRGSSIWQNFGQSFLYIGKNGKNNLYRISEAFLGRELTMQEEAEGISSEMLNSFVGKQAMVSVEPKVKGEKTYNNIIDYLKSNADVAPLTQEEKEKATVNKDKEEAPAQATQEQPAPQTNEPDPIKDGMPEASSETSSGVNDATLANALRS